MGHTRPRFVGSSGLLGWGGASGLVHVVIAAAFLLGGAAPMMPPGQEHVFQMVALPEAPQAAPVPQPEPVVEAPPEPEPEPEPEPVPEPEPEPEPEAIPEPPPPKPVEPPKPKAQPAVKPKPKAAAQPKPAPPAPVVPAAPVAAAMPHGNPQEYRPPDVTAAYRHNPPPSYPPAARRRGIEGVVVLAVDLGEDGRPRHVCVKTSSGFAMLDEAAEKAVRGWRFTPATRGGRPVAATVDVPVRFTLRDG